ncbi:MAG: aminoacyl-tRNA hydrolase [Clostridia bacterium]|nr:aminoacyl-tRNA hydrolase [Clostridia bacterium]
MFKKCTTPTPDWLIVGLGNPGKKYEKTRHNAGFICIDSIADELGIKIKKLKFNALVEHAVINNQNCLLMKPQTFMNSSGEAVIQAVEQYNIPYERVIVISDDVSFSVGSTRVRRNGSSGGQNGINNIILMLDTQNFPRIKVGVGKRPEDVTMVDWVLSDFKDEELEIIKEAAKRVSSAVFETVGGDIDAAMGKCNKIL